MLLKATLLLATLSLVWAQDSSTVAPTPAIVPATTAGGDMTSTPVPSNTPVPEVVDALANLSVRFDMDRARQLRRGHFYCLDLTTGTSEAMFPLEPVSTDTNSMGDKIYWALFVQYPVLSYLDSRRKENLLNIVAQLVQQGAASAPLTTFNESNFCIGKVVHYGVGTYQESLLINFYFSGVVNSLTSSGVSVQDFNTAFEAGLSVAVDSYATTVSAGQSTSGLLVQLFLERNALAIDSVSSLSDGVMVEENVHPGAEGLNPTEDPTLRAVVLGSFIGNTSISDAMNSDPMFASNPRPLSLGLEAGDFVFAVFGSVFITAVVALVVLGFFIHPFFLA